MAYGRGYRSRSKSYSSRSYRSGSRKRGGGGGSRRRTASRRSGSGRRSAQTVRVVIEHAAQSPVGRPEVLMGTAVAKEPKKKTF